MLKQGILNPDNLSLLARVRHTNTLVISDSGFPYWPELETVDISLVDDLPPGARFRVPLMVTVGRDSPATARQAARLLRERGATTDLTAGADRPSVGDPSALVAAIRRIHPE